MGWIHESTGRGDRVVMYVIAVLWVIGGLAGILWGRALEQQIVYPALCFVFAGLFASFARGEKGHFLSVDDDRFAWSWHYSGRAVKADLAVADLRELHREWEPSVVVDGRRERRRTQQVFIVLADGSRRRLPPHVLRDWATLVRELSKVRPDLKVVERETDDFSPAEV